MWFETLFHLQNWGPDKRSCFNMICCILLQNESFVIVFSQFTAPELILPKLTLIVWMWKSVTLCHSLFVSGPQYTDRAERVSRGNQFGVFSQQAQQTSNLWSTAHYNMNVNWRIVFQRQVSTSLSNVLKS